MVDAAALTNAIAATGCPILGVSIGDSGNRSTWIVQWSAAPTDAQRQAAADVIARWSDPIAVSGDAIIGAISKADRLKCDAVDLARIAWREDVPENNAKLARIAKAIGADPAALRAAAAQT